MGRFDQKGALVTGATSDSGRQDLAQWSRHSSPSVVVVLVL